jgi:hypothetical protein
MSFEVYVQMKSSTFNFDTERKLEMVAEMNYRKVLTVSGTQVVHQQIIFYHP